MNADANSRDAPLRVGLFGGTFNPIHRGHLQVALDVLAGARLDRIDFIPSALPPHKSTGKLASARDRLEMVRMTLDDHPRLKVCDAEINRSGPSYSIDTVRQCKAALPAGGRLYFILGVDAFLEIDTWKAFDRLFTETAFIVVSRPGKGPWSPAMRRAVETYAQTRIASGYVLSAAGDVLEHPTQQPIHLMEVTPVDIASRQIRTMIHLGLPIDAWVAPPVARYIQRRGLYR
jgi:nicotinate-nucleotide adenylyltransferase